MGEAASHLGEQQQAEVAYRRAVAAAADRLPAWQGLAELFAATGDLPGAVEANQRLVRFTAGRPSAAGPPRAPPPSLHAAALTSCSLLVSFFPRARSWS